LEEEVKDFLDERIAFLFLVEPQRPAEIKDLSNIAEVKKHYLKSKENKDRQVYLSFAQNKNPLAFAKGQSCIRREQFLFLWFIGHGRLSFSGIG
jgi:hypothetical protein